ncbi:MULTISPECIES: hypothetical protein [Sphingobacterium]|uniref:hypothetical protein n=1 Tax=Sphingobacterium TaxID=28453 RepID=UPI0013D9794F|nr:MULTISPECIES: hypothetical protein [unclassified Sphingobacterium]
MKHIIFVDAANIGLFYFRAFIFENNHEEVCFGIFLDDHTSPLIWFEQTKKDSVALHIDFNLAQLIGDNSQSDKKQRSRNFKEFMQFVKDSEHIASKMVFRGKQIEFLSKSLDLADIKKNYIK